MGIGITDFDVNSWYIYLNILILIEEMPQVETRVVLVQEAGKQEELIKALKVWSFKFLTFLKGCFSSIRI